MPAQDFFVSYAEPDQAWAEWIAWQLEANGYSVVIQAWDFKAGDNFVLEMHRASARTKATLAVLSKAYLQRVYTMAEWAAAFDPGAEGEPRRLIPIRIEDVELEGLMAKVVYFDLAHVEGESKATQALLRAIAGAVGGQRGKPAKEPPYPRGAAKTFPGATALPVQMWSAPSRRFVHARISAEGLSELETLGDPYADALDATAEGEIGAAEATCFLWLPRSEYLGSRQLQPLTPAAAICTLQPGLLVERMAKALTPANVRLLERPPRELRNDQREALLTTLAGLLPDAFVASIAAPSLLLAIGRRRTEFAYQALLDLFLAPLAELHRRVGVERFDLRLSQVGEKSAFVLGASKSTLKRSFPGKGAQSVTLTAPGDEDLPLVHAARLVAWAVGTYYNSSPADDRWISLLRGGDATGRS
ncbi:MAG TPA: toll/interleukin-1 receptor domain-containing protein [Thermoanaerobaculia bacterium]|nr:toll/interleukin-1 receptor domain-containing protein [Thermoanaerobaculia bacterium]